MLADTKKASKISFEELFFSSWDTYLKIIKKMAVIILLGIFIIALITALGTFLAFLIHYVLSFFTITNLQLLIINKLIELITFILFIILSAIIQILFINILLNPQIRFRDNFKSVKNYFWRIIGLIIIISLGGLIILLPIFSIFILVLANVPNIVFIATILFIFSLILACIAMVYFSFTPFILIEKNLSIKKTLSENFSLVKNNFFKILFFIALLWIVLGLINGLTYFISDLRIVNDIFNLVYLFFALPFIFVYLFRLYKIINR